MGTAIKIKKFKGTADAKGEKEKVQEDQEKTVIYHTQIVDQRELEQVNSYSDTITAKQGT